MQEALENITIAVKSGRTDIVKSLIDTCQAENSNLDFTLEGLLSKNCTPYGTLLHWATKLNDTDIVRTLLSAGADPTLKNEDAETSISFVSSDSMSSVYNEELLRATAQSKLDIVQKLLDAGVNVNCCDSLESLNTPLHWASSYSDVQTVKCLMDYGADVNVRNTSGTTPLHDAVDRGDLEIITLLLENGSSPLLRAHKGKFSGKNCLDLAITKPDLLSTMVQYSSRFDKINDSLESSLLKDSPSLESLISISQETGSNRLNEKRLHKDYEENLQSTQKYFSSYSSDLYKQDSLLQHLWPHPQILRIISGKLIPINEEIKVCIQASSKKCEENYEKVSKIWDHEKSSFEALGYEVNVSGFHIGGNLDKNALLCHVNGCLFKNRSEYKLKISENDVKLISSDCEGLFYGIQTLKQLLKLYANSDGLPNVLIHDYPNTKIRAALIDISIRFRVPTYDHLENIIRQFSHLKINQFHLYTRFREEADDWKHPFSSSEIIKLVQFCQEHSIELVPAIDIDHQITLENLPALTSFITKYVGCFRSNQVHLGPRLCSILLNPSSDDVITDLWKYLSFVVNCTSLYMCANSLHGNHDVINKLPLNVIFLDYGFHADYDFMSTCQQINDIGLCSLPCSGTAAWNSLAGCPEATIMNSYNAINTINILNLSGVVAADWTGSGHITDDLFNLPGFIVSAGFSWNISTPWDLLHDILPDLVDMYGRSSKDVNFSLGKTVMELGRIETYVLRASRNQDGNDVSNLPSAAGSTLHQLLIDPDNINLEHLTSEIFLRAIRGIKKAVAAIPKSTDQNEAQRLLLTADLMLIACRIGKSLTMAGQNPSHKTGLSIVNVGVYNLQNTTKTDLANRLLEIIDRYRNVWLSVNLAPGLQAALLLITSLIHKLLPDSLPEDSVPEQ